MSSSSGAIYVKIVRSKSDILSKLDKMIGDAHHAADMRNNVACAVQRVHRGSVLRKKVYRRHLAATEVERVFRGHVGRKKVRAAKDAQRQHRMGHMYMFFAIQLQRCFRGFYSRKYRQNHERRKAMLQEVVDKGEAVRRAMYEYAVEQAIREERERDEKDVSDFRNLAENLHHLLSTKQQRGVYNPPQEYVETPTIRGQPVERHIRAVVKDLLDTRGYRKTGLVKDFNGMLSVPLKTLKNKLSLQASAPYDCLQEEERKTKILHKVLSTNPAKKFFVSGGKTDIINHKFIPLNSGDAYVEAWANPMLIRGVPESQQQLNESAYTRKALFATAPAVPWFSAGGNMSSVRANDDFDTIADAQTTGGAAKRHLSVTKRYGVPDNCDYRPQDGSLLKAAPSRPTTLRILREQKKQHRAIKRPEALQRLENPGYQKAVEDPDSSSDEDDN